MPDRRERSGLFTTMIETAAEANQAGINTAMPGIIVDFDATKQTATIQPAIQYKLINKDGIFSWVDLPNLLDCPVFFPSGGGFTLTFPVAQGDECLIIFSQRCIDAWYSSGGNKNIQSDIRMHDLSDGFAFVGIRSIPRFLSNVSTSSTQLRSDDGSTLVDVASGVVTLTAMTVNINASTTNVSGELNVNGLLTYNNGLAGNPGSNQSIITGDIIQTDGIISSNGIVLDSHVHSGVESGGSNTGGPV